MSEQLQNLTRREIAAYVAAQVDTIGVSPLAETVQSLTDQTPVSRREFFRRSKSAASATIPAAIGLGVFGGLAEITLDPKPNILSAMGGLFMRRVNEFSFKLGTAAEAQSMPDVDVSYLSPERQAASMIGNYLVKNHDLDENWFCLPATQFPTITEQTNGISYHWVTDRRILEMLQKGATLGDEVQRSQDQERIDTFKQGWPVYAKQAYGVDLNLDWASAKLVYFNTDDPMKRQMPTTMADLTLDNIGSLVSPDFVNGTGRISHDPDNGLVSKVREFQIGKRPGLGSPNQVFAIIPSADGVNNWFFEEDDEGDVNIDYNADRSTRSNRAAGEFIAGIEVKSLDTDGYGLIFKVDRNCGNGIEGYPVPPTITPEQPATPTAVPENFIICESGVDIPTTREEFEAKLNKLGTSIDQFPNIEEAKKAYKNASCPPPASPIPTASPTATPPEIPTPTATPKKTSGGGGGSSQPPSAPPAAPTSPPASTPPAATPTTATFESPTTVPATPTPRIVTPTAAPTSTPPPATPTTAPFEQPTTVPATPTPRPAATPTAAPW